MSRAFLLVFDNRPAFTAFETHGEHLCNNSLTSTSESLGCWRIVMTGEKSP